ncbi:MAG: carbohydrate kinase family protein [Ruminococcus sp.]|nr:carbohydrate kinase family protein [Ruminococcus sp.]MCM1480512.1 carbohydrate kinase family protein [Muribaculaceae bacterium]
MSTGKFIYLYGMVMSTESFVLCGDFPKADGYGEISDRRHGIGGETGTAAAVLSSLGCRVKVGGTHIGNSNREIIRGYLESHGIDGGELADEDFPGIVDWVVISGKTRTCFGEWRKHFSRPEPFYEPPCEESVKNCSVVGWDNFYGKETAELCRRYGKKFAAIDCMHNSETNRFCAVNAVSHEFLGGHYPGKSPRELYRLYTENSEGLIIFTFGGDEVMYGRKGQPPRFFKPYPVDAVSTLGAGDSFKAGTVYALSLGLPDGDIVRYGCAVAGAAITRFPISENPPTLDAVKNLLAVR